MCCTRCAGFFHPEGKAGEVDCALHLSSLMPRASRAWHFSLLDLQECKKCPTTRSLCRRLAFVPRRAHCTSCVSHLFANRSGQFPMPWRDQSPFSGSRYVALTCTHLSHIGDLMLLAQRVARPCSCHRVATACATTCLSKGSVLIADIHLAVLVPTSKAWPEGRASIGAIVLAVNDANTQAGQAGSIGRGNLTLSVEEVECDRSGAIAALTRMLEDGPIDAVIGPWCSASCESTAYLTAGRDIPQISYSCNSAELSDKTKFPTVRSAAACVRARRCCCVQ